MSIDVLVTLSSLVGFFVVVPALTFLGFERRHRLRWRRREHISVAEPTPGGPFRDDELGGGRRGEYLSERVGAPPLVKVVAVTSLVLGHMFVPGLLAGLVGLMAYGLGLVSIPGLWLALRIYRNAFGLLRCELAAADDARRIADFAVTLNVVVVGVAFLLMAVLGLEPLLLLTLGYAAVSFAHAEGLRLSARAIEAAHRDPRERRAPTPAWAQPVAVLRT